MKEENSEEFELIVNNQKTNMYSEINRELQNCNNFIFNVAFVNFGGLQLLLDDLEEAEKKGKKGKIITSTYLNFTDPKALYKIKEFKNIQTKIFVSEKNLGFHVKCYIFEYDEYYKVYVGSSNITQSALKSNVEWNISIISKKNSDFINKTLKEFKELWESDNLMNNDEHFIREYENHLKGFIAKEKPGIFKVEKIIKPNYMQEKALETLKRIRQNGDTKGLVVASTGSGKTYMSAFDVKWKNPNKLLFLVHREDILKQAKKTFENILPNKICDMGFFTGNVKDENKDYIFATLQTMNNHFEKFNSDEFDYIVVDEAHHAASPTYMKLLDYFNPKFLLGMTATPERGDGENIFEIFGNNLALDLRFREALEHQLIVPFHYYGISDIKEVNLSNVKSDDIKEISKRLKINTRVDFIIEKIKFYGYDGIKMKGLGFCISIDHAEYMAEEFNKRGITSKVLSGKSSSSEREENIKRLEDDNDELEMIFTVDIFNEGVDIPSINLVLMLRPTNSPVVFIQQLGRGLRKYESKEFLTILDFIGNHNRAFLVALALSGSRYYDKDSIRTSVKNDFADIPGCVHIKMDKISKERILEQIEKENFNSMKYLKEEYNEFKKINQNKVPMLVDYLRYDGAPNPLKFIKSSSTYLGFLQKVEISIKEDIITYPSYSQNSKDGNKLLKTLNDMLPLKRIHEFVILKYLFIHEKVTKIEIEIELLKYLKKFDNETLIHSINYLRGDYFDAVQKERYISLIKFESTDKLITISDEVKKILKDSFFSKYANDAINYGILKYEEDYGAEYYGIPHLKLYEQYQSLDTAHLSNYTKILSAFRGSGVLRNEKDYFLFITLDKEEGIKESINYKDRLISSKMLQWQSQSATAQNSERGKDLIESKKRGIVLHIFIRKSKEIDGQVQPYIYIGEGYSVKHYGEKPITFELELENEIPLHIYNEFI